MSCPNLAAWNALHRARLPCTPSGTTALPTHPPARPAASRPAPEFIAQDDRYKVQARSYEAQYNNVYLRRAEELLADMTARAKAHWQDVQDGTTPVAAKIIDLREGQRLCIVGTVYKDSRLKPNVLHEFENERSVGLGPQKLHANYCAVDDTVILEDASGRCALAGLHGDLPVHSIVTGMLIAAKGHANAEGVFIVSEFITAGMAPLAEPVPEWAAEPAPEHQYAVLMSGIDAGGPADCLPLHMFVQWLRGGLGSEADVAAAAKVCRVIVAGGLVTPRAGAAAGEVFGQRAWAGKVYESLAEPMHEADRVLASIAPAVGVTVVPGAADPTTYFFPQQPLHKLLLPQSGRFSTVYCAPNPHACSLHRVHMLGTGGQNVDDVVRYTSEHAVLAGFISGSEHSSATKAAAPAQAVAGGEPEESMEGDESKAAADVPAAPADDPVSRVNALANLLLWRNVAPTAPDTIATYPFINEDPFIMHHSPHVLYAGNQPCYGSALVSDSSVTYDDATLAASACSARVCPTVYGAERPAPCTARLDKAVRVISVPNFAQTGTVVLLNLATLETRPLNFSVGGLAEEATPASYVEVMRAAEAAGVTLPGEQRSITEAAKADAARDLKLKRKEEAANEAQDEDEEEDGDSD